MSTYLVTFQAVVMIEGQVASEKYTVSQEFSPAGSRPTKTEINSWCEEIRTHLTSSFENINPGKEVEIAVQVRSWSEYGE